MRKRKGRTQDDVAHTLQMKRSTVSGYENEVSQPTIAALMAFSRYYGVAVDTLLTVDLTKLSESQLSQLERGADVFIKGSNLRVLATTVNSDNEENIELVPEKARAGYTNGFADPQFIRELPVFSLPFLSQDRKYRTFQLSGDSMLPIPDGSWVTGEFVHDWSTIISGHAYIILTLDEGIVFKVVDNKLDEGKLSLYSLNPLYEPFDVHVNDIREVWRFVNYISCEIPDPVLPESKMLDTLAKLKQDMDKVKMRIFKKQ